MFRKTKGQTVAEYAVLLSLVVAAAVAMQIYVKRGLQARVRAGTDAFTSVGANTEVTVEGVDGIVANIGGGTQYEPYYQESDYDRYQEQITQEHMGSGKVQIEKVSDVSAANAGGYEEQVDATGKGLKDAQWNEAAPAP